MTTRRNGIRRLWLAAIIGFASIAHAQNDCPQILGVTERTVHNPPWGPSQFVDIQHNGVLRMKLRWRGATWEFAVNNNPVSLQVDKNCMFSPEPLEIEAWKYCSESAKTTYSVTPGSPSVSVDAIKGPPGLDQFAIEIPWKVFNAFPYRLRAIHIPSNQVLRDSTNFEGTRTEGVTGVGTTADMEGPLLIALYACGLTDIAIVDLNQYGCDKNCNQKCNEMPECVGDPVNTHTGNMRYEEVDPLPANDFFPLRRTYLSRSERGGFFGMRWFSAFDSALKTFDDVDGTRYVSIVTEDRGFLLFSNRTGQFAQIAPSGGPRAKLVQNSDGSWTETTADGRLQRIFNAAGTPIAFRDVPTGREVTLTWNAGLPVGVADSWGNWSLTVTTDAATRRITAISLDGHSSRVWTYEYGSFLNRVVSPVGTWRTYEYAGSQQPVGWWRLTAVRDGQGNLVESHAYEGFGTGRALTSVGPGGDIDSISGREPGRASAPVDEYSSTIRYKTGRIEKHYRRWIAGAWRTVEVEGGCATCGSQYSSVVHDEHGNVVRAQGPDGYITETTYDVSGHNMLRTRTALRPSSCDPATATGRCRLTTDALAAAQLTETSATADTTQTYGDPNWPHFITRTETAGVMDPARKRSEAIVYDAPTGQEITRSVRGWTGNPIREETRVTSTTLYNGSESTAFPLGGAFDPSWLSLPQPRLRKQVDGPRTDVSDVTTFVYYPVHNSVPSSWRGRLAAVQNAAGHRERYADYDEYGNARRVIDANGVVQDRTYDALGRLTATTIRAVSGCDTQEDPLCNTDITQTSEFAGAGNRISERNAGGGATSYEYDSRGRVSTISRGPSSTDRRERIESQYDVLTGRRKLERWLAFSAGTWAERKRLEYVYDAEARVERVVHPDGASVAYAYDPMGRIVSVRDENHSAPNTRYRYDPAGRLIEVLQDLATEPAGAIATRYGYDDDGNVTSVTDPNGNVTSYLYDDFGQMLRQSSPVSGTTHYTYDAAGQVLTTTHGATSSATTRTYDAIGREISAATTAPSRPAETITWSYDKGAFGIGRLAGVTAEIDDPQNGTARTIASDYSWDRRGLLLAEAQSFGNEKYNTGFGYDADGNRSRIVYPSGQIVQYGFDYASRPISASTGQTTLVSAASHLPFGPPLQVTLGNGTTRVMTYDQRYRIRTNRLSGPLMTEEGSPVQGDVASYEYSYDAAGNITAIADLVDPNYGRQFAYDDLGRLTGATGGAGLWGAGAYAYDAMGNTRSAAMGRNLRTFTMAGTTPKIATVSKDGRIENVTYDAAGNETAVGSRTYEYSARDHLRAAGGRQFAYDGRGLRTTTTYTVTLSGFSLDLTAASPNQTFSGNVALSEPAPAGGLVVRLESSSKWVVVPKKVIVPAGQTGAVFPVTVGDKAKSGAVTLSATFGTTLTATLTVVDTPPLSMFTADPVDVVGGHPITATVTLAAPAPDGGAVVEIASEREAVAGGTIRIGGGHTSGSTALQTSAVPSSVAVPLTAVYGGSALQTTVHLRPVAMPDRLLLLPDTVVGGQSATGTITLAAPAPAGGRTFTLASSNPAIAQIAESSVTIPENGQSASFSIATVAVAGATPVHITAADASMTLQATLTVVCQTGRSPAPAFPEGQTVFIDEGLPAGAAMSGVFTWDASQAASGDFSLGAPYTGSGMDRGTIAGLTEPVSFDEKLFVYARVSECAAPRQIVVRAKVAGVWVTSYWGQRLWDVGPDAINMGAMPVSGSWTRLDVLLRNPADGDPMITDLELISVDGQVWFDRIGRMSDCVPPTAVRPTLPSDEDVIVDDTAPASVTFENRSNGPLAWSAAQAASGSLSLLHPYRGEGTYVTGISGLSEPLGAGSKISLYALVDTCSPAVRQLHFRVTTTTGSRTVSWGEPLWDIEASTLHKGPVPAAGSWSRLEIPLDQLGLDSGTLTRIDVAHVDGRVWFDRIALWPVSGARLTSFASDRETTVAVGTTVTWTATATGTVHPLQYRFERRDPLGNWSIVQPYGAMNTYTWTPTDAGGYAIRVSVRNGGSLADFEDTATLPLRVEEGEAGARVPVTLGSHYGPLATATLPRRHSLYTPELQLLAETEITTASKPPVQYEYVWFAGQPLAQISTATGEIHWYFNDHLGTPILQTAADAAILWRVESDPYGTVFTFRTGAEKHQPLRFPGQENDGGGELTYNVFRWYRAGWGRYTSSDPLGLAVGMNLYAYVDANPVNYSDPLGLIKPVHPSKQKYRPCNNDEIQKCQASCKYGMESCMVSQTFKIIKMTGGKTLYGWVDGPMSCSCKEPDCWDKLKEWADPKKWFDPNPTPPLPPFLPIPPSLPTPKPVIPGLPPFFVNPCMLNPSLCYGDTGIT